ncbi:MAG: translation elongation factor Ts [Chloroflexi bacterium]|nr:MAG: translation elongation factor Ts [Chloroflexota bacterium]
MVQITAQMVKQLREATGAGPLDCKKALEAHEGDMEKAMDFLREKGLARAAKKLGAGRTMNEGVVATYVHHDKRLAAMVEVNCETDFVAKTPQFQEFAHNLAVHIASMAPEYVKREDVPEAVVQAERELQLRRAMEEGKPEHIAEKMVEGRLNKWFEDIVLMDQTFFKDEDKTIADLLNEAVAELGESIQIRRFVRFVVGEDADDGGEDA